MLSKAMRPCEGLSLKTEVAHSSGPVEVGPGPPLSRVLESEDSAHLSASQLVSDAASLRP